MSEEILWRRLDRPGSDYARLSHDESGWRLAGVSLFQHEGKPCRLDYTILCDAQWQTQAGWVTGRCGEKNIDVEILVDDHRTWCINGAVRPDVSGSIDLDLHFSPATCLFPIHRFKLPVGGQATVISARLCFPDFTLEPLEQSYLRADQDTYHYEAGHGKFKTELKVNGSGFVTHFPGFWTVD
ncbi:MAG TPA: putative glycolipid-binding domain-containing protein [Nitrospirota bacterium]|nr:putative glycolipid-binding domain-containing protein [Nitrospirota bacterium]